MDVEYAPARKTSIAPLIFGAICFVAGLVISLASRMHNL
jgi:hypothetical protein